jgi:hypothetical protein
MIMQKLHIMFKILRDIEETYKEGLYISYYIV